jgi:hypothetical protein
MKEIEIHMNYINTLDNLKVASKYFKVDISRSFLCISIFFDASNDEVAKDQTYTCLTNSYDLKILLSH